MNTRRIGHGGAQTGTPNRRGGRPGHNLEGTAMTPAEALTVLAGEARKAFYAYADRLDLSDPESIEKLRHYAERLADWLEASMKPIIKAAQPRVLH